jgi:ABC-type transport system substrate-binding protein
MIKLILLLFIPLTCILSQTVYRQDDAASLAVNQRMPHSHIKVFIPSMPYLYVSKLINGTLIRSSDNTQGWEFMLASKLERQGDLVYIFTLRKNMKFQDGTPFDANSVLENFNAFINNSLLYKLLRERLQKVEKLSAYKIKFTFNQPYELFF